MNTMKNFEHIYNSKRLSVQMKIRHFKTFIESVFLYHSEIWTTNKTINDSIDAFHRRLLRYAIGVKYPKIMSDKQVYEMTKCIPWSETIKHRRLSWLGHLMRLDPEVPARLSLAEALTPAKRKVGHPPTTWLMKVKKDLKNLNIDINLDLTAIPKLEAVCCDRISWRARCGRRSNLRDAVTCPSNRSWWWWWTYFLFFFVILVAIVSK